MSSGTVRTALSLIRRRFSFPVRGNVLKTGHRRTALFCYLEKPFLKGAGVANNNESEALLIAEGLNQLGYNVDVVQYNSLTKIDYSRYSLIFGFGEALIGYFYSGHSGARTIYYGTGMHVSEQNHRTLARVAEVFRKKGIYCLDSGRMVPMTWSEQTELVDGMVVIGNRAVADTYEPFFGGPREIIEPSFIRVTDASMVSRERSLPAAKKNFLWFGSAGAVHKGLDLLLEVFADLPEAKLHICGPVAAEKNFCRAYAAELGAPNIVQHGFVDIKSDLFVSLLRSCAWTVFPSCSEGSPASVRNVIGNGALIPVITNDSGLNLRDVPAIEIRKLDASEIRSRILTAMRKSDSEIRRETGRMLKYIQGTMNPENFIRQVREAVGRIAP